MKSTILRILSALVRSALNAIRRLLGLAPLGPDVTEFVEDVVDRSAEDAVEDDGEEKASRYSETLADRIRVAAGLRLEGASVVHLFAGSDETELSVSAWMMWMPAAELAIIAAATDAALHGHLDGRLIPGVGALPRIATHREMAGLDPAPEMAPDPVRVAKVTAARLKIDSRVRAIRGLEREDVGDDVREWFEEFFPDRETERA